MKSFRPRAYPGRAVLVDTGISPERKLKMQVLYEPNWSAGGWHNSQLSTTNYSDWLRDSSDPGTDSDESLPKYMSVPPATAQHHYEIIAEDRNQKVVLEPWSNASLRAERLWVESATEKPKANDEKKRVQRSQSCRTKGTKFSQLAQRNAGHDLQPLSMDPMYENLSTTQRSLPQPPSIPSTPKTSSFNLGFATLRKPLKQSKSMRSLKDVSWNPEGDSTAPKNKLKHSKSMRSLKNKDRGSRTSSEDSSKSNTLRRFLKIPEILRSSPNVRDEWEDIKPMSGLKPATSLNGFDNPAVFGNGLESAEYRLSKLLVNSKPFSTASQTMRDSVVYEEPHIYNEPEQVYENIPGDDILDDLSVYNKTAGTGKESKSLFRNLTLRIKKKMSRNSVKTMDEYTRAGVYGTTNVLSEAPVVPPRVFPTVVQNSVQTDADDFAIPRPKLIVPVHTYGIRKRRTGNTVFPARTRSDGSVDVPQPVADFKKVHHSCPGRIYSSI